MGASFIGELVKVVPPRYHTLTVSDVGDVGDAGDVGDVGNTEDVGDVGDVGDTLTQPPPKTAAVLAGVLKQSIKVRLGLQPEGLKTLVL